MTKEKTNSIFEQIKGAIFAYIEKLYRKNLYVSLEDERFTMKSYIKIVCDENLNALKKRRIFTIESVLQKVWIEIIQQYAELTKNKEIKNKVDRNEQIQTLYNRITILRGCYMALSVTPEEQRIIKFLSDSGIRADGHSKMLKRLESEMKMISIKIKDLSTLNKVEHKEQKKATRSDYSVIFVTLKKAGYSASIEMPVIDFVNAINMYRAEVEENNKQLANLKAKKNGKL